MEHERGLEALLVHSAEELGLKLTNNQVVQFICYLTELIRWNETVNLTGIDNPEEIVIKHFIDSLTGLATANLPAGWILADVGTGAGFPGLPIKIVRNDIRLRLIEPNHKKCSFLTSVVGLLKLSDAEVFHGTSGEYRAHRPGSVNAATVRALRFDEVSGELYELLAPKGLVILYRTNKLDPGTLQNRFRLVSERLFSLPRRSGDRVISVLERN